MFTVIVRTFGELVLLIQLSCVFVVGQTLVRFSFTRKIVVRIMHKAASVSLPEELYWNSLFTWPMMKALWQQEKLDMRKTALRGKPSPNPLLVDPSSGDELELSKALNPDKLQVLAFGSYSCPVFRMKLNKLTSIAEEFHNVADFSLIYIDEAHPADGWAFNDETPILKHRTQEDRLKAVHKLCALNEQPLQCLRVYADSMRNEASQMFGVNAIRLYIIQNRAVLYEGGVGPTYYSLDEVKEVLSNTCTLV